VKLLHEAPSLLHAADLALPSITRFSRAFKPALDELLPAAREIAPVISFIGLYNRELVAGMANLAADLQATASANTPTGTANYIRAIIGLGPDSIYGQTIREPSNRSNTYFAPGELTNIGNGGLLSATCENTHNPAQVPLQLLFSNVPCRVQPGFNWGHGITPAYYPHLTRAPLPKK
jgi:hypothetical protein